MSYFVCSQTIEERRKRAEKLLARLERDHPTLAAQVRTGTLSLHAAAVQAGFRVKTIRVPLDDVPRAAAILRRHFGSQVSALKRALLSEPDCPR